jgi:hypothetical protein
VFESVAQNLLPARELGNSDYFRARQDERFVSVNTFASQRLRYSRRGCRQLSLGVNKFLQRDPNFVFHGLTSLQKEKNGEEKSEARSTASPT